MPIKCCVENCNNTNIIAKGLCRRHYLQMYRHGKILQRTVYDANDFIIHKKEQCCEIVCYDKFGNVKAIAKVDLEDYKLVKEYKWRCLNEGYIVANKDNILLHRLIMREKIQSNEDTVDHINRDKLDNRKSNLRIVTKQVNSFNKGLQKNNSSGARGVRVRTLKSGKKVYDAIIRVNGKDIYLGYFTDFNQAVSKRKEGEQKFFGKGIVYDG